ncbi:DUF1648 domain-containing protein [Microbacterium suwonense]|uniref:DUF1648 domain-containing protein n=1 Tax=Microbacterium suwonense TaxID=683047 RepID=A0ABM8FTF1_9MICO|nr:DUF1648 domain-containing protein [Microbacterium suwonense]BDZ38957.1 hypothetical protein GCM10025863_15710 [Microbacterium suwonense]
MNPDVRRSRTAFLRVGLIAPLALLVAAAVVIVAWMPELPDPMAIHWGEEGVNGYAPKWAYIALGLGIGVAVVVLTAVFAMVAHRLPQSSVRPAVGPWSPTARFMGALNLGLGALIATIAVAGAWIQRGLSDAADAPGIGIPTLIGFVLMAVLTALGWFLQPRSPETEAEQPAPAGSIPLATTERAAWFGTATMARSGVIVLISALTLLAAMTVFFLAAGEDGSWILLIVTAVMAVLIGTMVVFRVRVNGEGLRVRSLLGWPNSRIPLDRIEKVETVQLDPFREFGGWGWRLALDGRRGVVLRAGEALQVTRTDGRVFVVTVDGASAAAATLDTLRAHTRHG